MSRTKSISIGLICLVWFGLTANGWAKHPLTRQVETQIESIDQTARTLTIRIPAENKLLTIEWNARTSFYRDGKRVSLLTARPGMKVRVHYRTPLFGERFATRIIWSTGNVIGQTASTTKQSFH